MTWDLPPELLGQPPTPMREPPPYVAYDTPGRWTLYSRPTIPRDEPDDLVIQTADGRVVGRFQASEHLHHMTLEYVRLYPTERDLWTEALRQEAERIAADARAMQPKPPMPLGDDPRAGLLQPPIWHDDGSVTLWHPESPGMRVRIDRPRLLRRTVRRRRPFATVAELTLHRRAHSFLDTAIADVIFRLLTPPPRGYRPTGGGRRPRTPANPPMPPPGPGGGSPRIPTSRGFRV